ncbi:MAG: hypothetical protein MI725_04330, partial [Pirellulales bacterium]|nr:hypothetical protein [Pirellulales bacterium]
MSQVVVSASFDDLRSRDMRLLQEAARLGAVHVLLWSDETVRQLEGQSPKFPQEERRYFVGSIRYVQSLTLVDLPGRDVLPTDGIAQGSIWAVEESQSNPVKEALCRERSLKLWSI